ncbi:MAG: DMT family transporter [Devosia sp.]|jgi:drug/metabolite transporter (DMT)-like permease
MRIIALTVIAMIAFAANSVLARLAFATAGAEPLSYTGIRLAAGAATLAVLLALRRRNVRLGGSWSGVAALFGYAILFSIAYILLGAGTGALILFASVQIGMLGWAVYRGDRPGLIEWLGFVVAFGGLVYLLSPGVVAPNPLGALLMLVAGLCWAAYTLIGRASTSPLDDTAGNFMRSSPLAVVMIVAGALTHGVSLAAVIYAIVSGALASGLGYAVWYTALPSLSRTRAAIVQLTVPAIAGAGGVLFIGEALSPRLVIATIAIIGGVALAVISSSRRRT